MNDYRVNTKVSEHELGFEWGKWEWGAAFEEWRRLDQRKIKGYIWIEWEHHHSAVH